MAPPLDYFVPNRDAPAFDLLGSFIPASPRSVAERYIEALSAPGDLLLDPFAFKPVLGRLAEERSRRAIAFNPNPFCAWLASALAAVPHQREIFATLTRLGDAIKDDTPLRQHIAQLYATRCAECAQLTPADYFLYEHGLGPIQRHYTCAQCGAARDDPATPEDLERASKFEPKGFHYHWAFERVVPPGGMHAQRIRNLLDLYTPRNLYALVTLTVKSDTLLRSQSEQRISNLLLLHLLDRGTSLYAEPEQPARLTRHKRFVEFNLWRELELAARALGEFEPLDLASAPSAVFDASAPSVWIGSAGSSTIGEAIPGLQDLQLERHLLVLTSPPPRQSAIGALLYFFGAWTKKHAAVQPLITYLDPKTNDPAWERKSYFDTMTQSLSELARVLPRQAKLVFIFDESSYEAIEALLLAAAGAGMNLDALLFQPRLGDAPRWEFGNIGGSYRMVFGTRAEAPADGPIVASDLKTKVRAAALDAGRDILGRRAEPLAFNWLHHAAYSRAAQVGLLREAMHVEKKIAPGRLVFEAVREGLRDGYAHDFDHVETKGIGETAGHTLWLRREKLGMPLIDRIEEAVRRALERGTLSRAELEDEIYRSFSGDLTPEAGLIELCAHAFADERDGRWMFRDELEQIADEKARAEGLVLQLGERLGYAGAREAKPFDWAWREGGEIAHGFVWRDHAAFSDLGRLYIAPARGYLMVPQSRIELLAEKARRLPHLVEAFNDAGWDFVRLLSLEKMAEKETLGRSDLVLMLGLAPMVAEPSAQLELF